MKTITIAPTRNRENEGSTCSALLNAIKEAHLEITSNISSFIPDGASPKLDLFQAQFNGLVPEVRTHNDTVAIQFNLSPAEWVKHTLLWNRHTATMSLTTSIPWEINLRSVKFLIGYENSGFQVIHFLR